MRSLSSQVAGATAIALTSTVVASRMGDAPSPAESQSAYNTAFLMVAAGLVGAVLIALKLPRRNAAPAEREVPVDAALVVHD